MAERGEEALRNLLIQSGLSDPKWFEYFNDRKIMHPDDILNSEEKEELYHEALSIATEKEDRFVQKLFDMTEAKSVFVKVHKALEDAGLDALYWSKVFAIQAGVITEQALNYIDDGFYLHLAQFARFAEERRALFKLLNVEKCEHNFSSRYEEYGKGYEVRRQVIEECISKLKDLQEEDEDFCSTAVKEIRQRALECLQIPEEFWLADNTYKTFIHQMLEFNQQMTSALENHEYFYDFKIVQNASSGLALKGVHTQSGNQLRHCGHYIIQVPRNVILHYPFFPQYVKHMTLPKSDTEWELSLEEEIFSKYVKITENSTFMTIKTFVVPLASCFFEETKLKLTDEAVAKLKEVEKLSKSNVSLMTKKCTQFYEEFGSYICLGPFHFGGHFHWCCSSPLTEDTDISVIKRLHSEAIVICQGNFSTVDILKPKNVEMVPGLDKTNYPESLLQHTSIRVGICGGPQIPSVTIWRNRLIVEEHAWVLLDRGNTLISLWDMITKYHANNFENAPCLAETMMKVFYQSNMPPSELKLSNFESHLKEFVQNLEQWNQREDRMKHYQQLLTYIHSTREEVIMKEMDLEIWPKYYLSQTPVQQCLILLVGILQQQHHQESQSLLRWVIRPIDLEAIPEFPKKDQLRKLIFEFSEELEACDLNDVGKICKLASKLLHRIKDSNEADHDVVSHPKKALGLQQY